MEKLMETQITYAEIQSKAEPDKFALSLSRYSDSDLRFIENTPVNDSLSVILY